MKLFWGRLQGIYKGQHQVEFQGGLNINQLIKLFWRYKNIWYLPAIPSCWVYRLLTVLYDCHFELNTFSHHLLCRWQSALSMTELKPQEHRAVHWKYITISRYLLSTLDLAVISSSKSLSISSSLSLFSQNTLLCTSFRKLWRGDLCQSRDHPL